MGVDLGSSESTTDLNSEIKFNDYFVVVRTFGKGSTFIDIVDLSTNKFYQIENYMFSQFVSMSTLIAGLERKSQEISASIARIEDKENGNKLKIQVSVNISYLPKLEETILLENKPISSSDLLGVQLKIASNEIDAIKSQLDIAKSYKKYVHQLRYKNIQGVEEEQIGNFQLPKGNYRISVHFDATYSGAYVYFMIMVNGYDVLQLRDQPFTLDENCSSGNLIFNLSCSAICIYAVNTVSINTQYGADYQWEMKNLIISAEELPN